MARVLYISYDGMTDPLGQSQVLPYLIGLSKKGHKFTLLSTEKKESLDKLKDKIQELCDRSDIRWEYVMYSKKPPVLSTVKDVWALQRKAFKLHKNLNFDIIHCRSYIASLIGLKFKQKYQVPFIFDMRGFWADERVEGNIWDLSNPIFKAVYSYFKNKEKCFIIESSYVISLTEKGAYEIESWGLSNAPIAFIPTCSDVISFDYNLIDIKHINDLKKKLSLQNGFPIISYLGSTGTWYLLEEMFVSFKEIKNLYPSSKFLFITRDDSEDILKIALQQGLKGDDLVFVSGDRDQMPLFISLSDINIFYIKPSFSKTASAPTKLGEVMAMGVPVIANKNVGDVENIVTDEIGHLVDTDVTNELKDVSNHINGILSLDKETIRNKSIELFALENGVGKYHTVYEKVLYKTRDDV